MNALATPFVLVCAERTGSNLLLGLLQSHPDCKVAGELFNPAMYESQTVPGFPLAEQATLSRLRAEAPGALIQHVYERGERQGARAVGFKFMYGHAKASPAALDYLLGDRRIHVIHLRRGNLLHRLVSHRQAKSTGVWGRYAGAETVALPKIGLSVEEVVKDFRMIERRQAEYAECFKTHPVLEVNYEELSAAPHEVGARVASFLGLRADVPLVVRYQKTGNASMRDAIINHDELKSSLPQWAAFFDD